ncbi:unnamed protein product [Camellia sinensis]
MPHPTLLLRRTSQDKFDEKRESKDWSVAQHYCMAFDMGDQECYFLDFLGPRGFVAELSWRTSCEVIGFNHRKSVLSKISSDHDCSGNLTFHVDIKKSSSTTVYEYFSAKLSEMKYGDGNAKSLLNPKDRDCMVLVFKYIEDADLRRWILPNIKAFNIRLGEWHSMLNGITNPHMYEQKFISKRHKWCALRFYKQTYMQRYVQDAVKKLLDKVFKVRLGKGFYGECLMPIGVVGYMQRNNLKMCLRSTDTATDTSEVAKVLDVLGSVLIEFALLVLNIKAYGGGGSPSSSSFIIRMDEYNQWLSL